MKLTRTLAEQADPAGTTEASAAGAATGTATRRQASRGQVLVIFAAALVTLLSLSAVVIDVSWYWANTLRVQRAADAAALAGVVNLPGNVPGAISTAVTAAGENGYTNGTGGVTVAPTQDLANDRQLDVTVSAPVSTFFMRLVGINSITATRTSKALYVLPVPMGSPLNYLGVGCFRTQSGTQPVCTTAGNSNGASGIPNSTVANPVPLTGPTAPSQLNSQGFFDSAITKGGDSGNGDAYDPSADSGRGGANPTYNPAGVYYEVLIPPGDSGGSVSVFDPGYCAVNASYGTGDHWIGGPQNAVSTYYNLWNTNGNVYAPSQFSLVAASGSTFESQTASDTALGGPAGLSACDAYHDKWWPMASGLAAGLYYLQVTTTKVLLTGGGQTADPAGTSLNASTNAENMYSLEVNASGGTTPQVFGAGKMVAYNNVNGGKSALLPGPDSEDRCRQDAGDRPVRCRRRQRPGDPVRAEPRRQRLLERHLQLHGRLAVRQHLHGEQCVIDHRDHIERGSPVQRLVAHDPHSAAEQLRERWPHATRGDTGRLVEDQLPDRGRGPVQRHDDVAGWGPRQPRAPDRAVGSGRLAAEQPVPGGRGRRGSATAAGGWSGPGVGAHVGRDRPVPQCR